MVDYERAHRLQLTKNDKGGGDLRPIAYSYTSFVNSISLRVGIEVLMMLTLAIIF
jgi:hypothetical protein